MNEKGLILESEFEYIEKTRFQKMLLPFEKLIKGVEKIHDVFLKIIFNELFKGDYPFSNITTIALFFVFLIASVFAFKFPGLFDFVILAFMLVWLIDYIYVKILKMESKHKIRIQLCRTKNKVVIKKYIDEELDNITEYGIDQILDIHLSQETICHGGLNEFENVIWDLYIEVKDEESLFMHISSNQNLEDAWRNTEKITSAFNLNPRFKNQANHLFINDSSLHSNNLEIQNIDEGNILSVAYSGADLPYLLNRIFDRSGLLLFALVFSEFLAKMGHFFYVVLLPKFGFGGGHITLDISFGGILNAIMPEMNAVNIFEISVAFFILSKALQAHLKKKKLVLKGNVLMFCKGGLEESIALHDSISLHYLDYEDPLIIVNDHEHVLLISDLPNLKTYRSVYNHIQNHLKLISKSKNKDAAKKIVFKPLEF